jgi:hypothetical protein
MKSVEANAHRSAAHVSQKPFQGAQTRTHTDGVAWSPLAPGQAGCRAPAQKGSLGRGEKGCANERAFRSFGGCPKGGKDKRYSRKKGGGAKGRPDTNASHLSDDSSGRAPVATAAAFFNICSLSEKSSGNAGALRLLTNPVDFRRGFIFCLGRRAFVGLTPVLAWGPTPERSF